MTLVHFPRMTIQPFDAKGAPKGEPIVVQGDTNKAVPLLPKFLDCQATL